MHAHAAVPVAAIAPLRQGETRIFGTLKGGTLLVCRSHGVRVTIRVPAPKPSGVAFAQAPGKRGTALLEVRRRPNGSVVAKCS
jgi:hypothetical protein